MLRKPQSSTLDKLPEHQREVIERWLFEEKMPYEEASQRAYDDFAVRCSESSLARWYQRRAQERVIERIALRAAQANKVQAEFASNPANTSEALMNLVGQLAFEEMLREDKEVSIKTVSDLTSLVLAHNAGKLKAAAEERKERELALKRDKLELDFQKYRDSVATAKRNIETALASGKAGAITRETIERIQEELRLI